MSEPHESSPGGPPAVQWEDSGKPRVSGGTGAQELSVSHDDEWTIAVSGDGEQGVDVQPIEPRDRRGWISLLGAARTRLLDALVGEGDSLDEAGTRIWCAVEAIRKATGAEKVEPSPRRRRGPRVIFAEPSLPDDRVVLTFPMDLPGSARRMVAVVAEAPAPAPAVDIEIDVDVDVSEHDAPAPAPAAPIASEPPAPRLTQRVPPPAPSAPPPAAPSTPRATPSAPPAASLGELGFREDLFGASVEPGPQGQPVYVERFPLTFQACSNVDRSVYFTHFFKWMGVAREHSTQPILEDVATRAATGRWGLVTNSSEVTIVGQAGGHDLIETRVWLEAMPESGPSSFDIAFDWRRVIGSGGRSIARGKLRATWVEIVGHGLVRPAPFPEFLRDFLQKMGAERLRGLEAPSEDPGPHLAATLGALRSVAKGGPSGAPVLHEEIFDTDLEDANLIGNVYFAHYSRWQGKVRDRFFHGIDPHLYMDTEGRHPTCVRCRVTHLREAMPFDRVLVQMRLVAVHATGVRLRFEYHRVGFDGAQEKLAVGDHDARCESSTADRLLEMYGDQLD